MPVYKREYKCQDTRKPAWCYVFHYRKQRFAKSGFPSKQIAADAERVALDELKSKRAIPQPRESVTVSELMPHFLEHRSLTKSDSTVVNERHRSKNIVKVFGVRLVSDIYSGELYDYLAQRRKEGISNRAINLELTFMRSFFKYAVQQRYASYNPGRDVDSLPEVREEKWIPSQDEFKRFAEATAKTSTGKYLYPWIMFRAFTGTRPSESFHVEWEDVDFERDQIIIRPKEGHTLKNKRFRVVELHPELKPILLSWRDEWLEIKETWEKRHGESFPHSWVFINPRNSAERARGYNKAFCSARKAACLPKMQSYTLRHYFISYCVMSGVPFFTISKWVGHRNTRMIEEVYGHLSNEYQASQMAKLKIMPDSDAA